MLPLLNQGTQKYVARVCTTA